MYHVKLDYLFSISNPKVKPEFELQDKTAVSYDELKQDILEKGILEPLVIITNNKGIRLESGNHRIYILKDIGATSAPCVIIHSDTFNPGNGNHLFK